MPTMTKEREKRVLKMKIYKVTYDNDVRLIRATSQAKAIKFIMAPVTATIATQDELVQHLAECKVEEAGI